MRKVLIVTPFFLPNIGGAETYVFELCEYLRTHDCLVNVLTYQPVTTPGVRGPKLEKKENITIRRYQWIGFNLFNKLEKLPFLNFLYLTPYLLLRSFIWMLFHRDEVEVIDGQGFNSAVVALILRKIFKKKAVVTVVSLYDFVPGSRIAKFVKWEIDQLDHVIVESEVSKKEICSLGVAPEKITPYKEWVDQTLFKPADKTVMKTELNLKNKFTVLFVGRAIKIKGADIILDVARQLQNVPIQFVFISNAGPMMEDLRQAEKELNNVTFIGGVPYNVLPKYEAAADLAVVPSKYSENAAITVVTAACCGTPVVASNMGAIPSLMDEKIGITTAPEVENFKTAILKIFNDPEYYKYLQTNCRPFAEKNFSINNAQTMLNVYNKTLADPNIPKTIFVTRPVLPTLMEYTKQLEKIWDKRWLTNHGDMVTNLENELKKYLGVENLIAVTNGMLALQLLMKAFELKGEVITTPFTFAATTNVLVWENLTPIFADIDPETFNIDPASVEKQITEKTSAILVVHVYGNPCYVQDLQAIAERHNIKLLYDAAHAFAVDYRGTSVLNYGDASILSFHATKAFNTIEGGAIIAKDKEILKKLMLLRDFGIESEEKIIYPGINAKMNEFQGAMGLCLLPKMNDYIEQRKTIYERYRAGFNNCDVKFQKIITEKYNYAYAPICLRNKTKRDEIFNILLQNNIKARKYFYPLVTSFDYFNKTNENLVEKHQLHNAANIADRVLCLPIYPDLELEDVNRIIKIIKTNI